MKKICVFFVGCWLFLFTNAQSSSDTIQSAKWSVHGQATAVTQYHPSFTSPYSGNNSLQSIEPAATSITATLYAAVKLGKHTYAVGNLEAAGGKGLSSTLGVAGFPNGEVYRVGSPTPIPFIARCFIEHRWPLKGNMIQIESDVNQIAETTASNYISLVVGKFSLLDYFDDSEISHDPRTQFMNWSLMGEGAWDYPANTRGYTFGAMLHIAWQKWGFRLANVAMPVEANGAKLEYKGLKSAGWVIELERNHLFYKNNKKFSTLHAGAFLNRSQMGSYADALYLHPTMPDVTETRQYSRNKWGMYANIDNHINQFHWFAKASFNDGKNESWAFTEIDNSVGVGIQIDAPFSKKSANQWGVAFVSNGLSTVHAHYLQQGGYGFIIGDGNLQYTRENILETYYSIHLGHGLTLSPNYQWVSHPAYNKDRGPVHFFALRLHKEW